MSELPTLYFDSNTGQTRFWSIKTKGNKTIIQYGVVDGKVVTRERKHEPTNVGKTNEKTGEEQAKDKAFREWINKVKKSGYKPRTEDGIEMMNRVLKSMEEQRGTTHNAIAAAKGEKGRFVQVKNLARPTVDIQVWPLLATQYTEKHAARHLNFEEGVYVQPKLDGWRCIARLNHDGEVVITTRSGNQNPWLGPLREALKKFFNRKGGMKNAILDGELYEHEIIDQDGNALSGNPRRQMINRITALKTKSPHPLEGQVGFWVFDMVDPCSSPKSTEEPQLNQDQRFELLDVAFEGWDTDATQPKIHRVETTLVHSFEEVEELHEKYVAEGYEGVVLRSRELIYQSNNGRPYRSPKLVKYKAFDDDEFEIIGYKDGQGIEEGCVIWTCKTKEGRTFDCRPLGTHDERKDLYKRGDEYIGKNLNVRYFGYTVDKIPNIPIGYCIRDEE